MSIWWTTSLASCLGKFMRNLKNRICNSDYNMQDLYVRLQKCADISSILIKRSSYVSHTRPQIVARATLYLSVSQ